jgi:hypothetical protein
MKPEIIRRVSLKNQLRALFEARPLTWIPLTELARVGGAGGWRTRLSELSRENFPIVWNRQNGLASAHMYRPQAPLGRDASVPAPDRFDGRQRRMF